MASIDVIGGGLIVEEKKCPICKKEMKEFTDVLDGWCLMEWLLSCPDKCYSYHYYTGVTNIQVKDKTFTWYYTAPAKKIKTIEKKVEQYIKQILPKEE